MKVILISAVIFVFLYLITNWCIRRAKLALGGNRKKKKKKKKKKPVVVESDSEDDWSSE